MGRTGGLNGLLLGFLDRGKDEMGGWVVKYLRSSMRPRRRVTWATWPAFWQAAMAVLKE